MEQVQHPLVQHVKKGGQWKHYLIDGLLAILVVVPITLIIFALQIHPDISTVLLVYLFIVLWLAHQRGFWVVVLAALTACVAIDYFLMQPRFSFAIANFGEGLALFVFLLLAVMLGFMYSKSQERKQQEHDANILYQEKLRKQAEEVTRHDYEADTFYNVVQVTRDKNDLKYQLGFITRAIEEAFSFCGLRSCVIFVPDLDGKLTLQRLPEQENAVTALTTDEMRSVTWVMEKGKSVTLPNIPLIARAKGSYLRRAVVRSSTHESVEHGYSYIVPLLSGQKVLGVLRLLVEDNAHPRLLTIKNALEMECPATDVQPELFTKLRNYAVSLIQQALIERALMQEEYMRQELSRRTEELQAAIISSVSHDLRTPLVAIKAAATNLLDEEMLHNEHEEYRHAVETIIDEADWLGRILMRMLDVSRIEQGALKIDKELYPIEMVILTTLELKHIRSLLQDRVIQKSVPEELPPVEVDPLLIGQVLANLIENAIRHTPATEPIEISVQANRGEMLISVADRGPGIPPAETERIFEKFYRVERKVEESEGEVPTTQGTGLGLAVCRGFVAAHGGRIWVQNRAGGGAEFQFTLPLKKTGARDYHSISARGGDMKKILVVDDKAPTLLQLKRSLERYGYEVYTASRGKEALQVLDQESVDLILLDLKLPDMGGLQVCKEVRVQYSSLPIIIISVVSDVERIVEALNQGADDYVHKPFDMSEVLARIGVQLRHSHPLPAKAEGQNLIVGPLSIDFEQRWVKVNDQKVELTYTEYELLSVLARNRGRIVTYDILISEVWGYDEVAEWQSVHTYINRLRKKIETPANRRFIRNEPKIGYRFVGEE